MDVTVSMAATEQAQSNNTTPRAQRHAHFPNLHAALGLVVKAVGAKQCWQTKYNKCSVSESSGQES